MFRHQPQTLSAKRQDRRRKGTVLAETAIVAPVFFLFLVAIVEFGHAFMAISTLNAAAKQAARQGALENSTNADITNTVNRIVGSAFDVSEATVEIKDGAVFDTAGVNPATIDYSSLPSFNAATAEPGDLFIVRISVPYSDIAILPPFWGGNMSLRGQSVARHE